MLECDHFETRTSRCYLTTKSDTHTLHDTTQTVYSIIVTLLTLLADFQVLVGWILVADVGGPQGLADGAGAALAPVAGELFALRVTGQYLRAADEYRIAGGSQMMEKRGRQRPGGIGLVADPAADVAAAAVHGRLKRRVRRGEE